MRGAIMHDFFRLKVVSKRQVTFPQLMLEKLHLEEGDELEVEIADGAIVAVRPLKLVPTDFFSSGMLKKLEARSKAMDSGRKAARSEPEKGSETEPQVTASERWSRTSASTAAHVNSRDHV
jgi:bifunctional DNA-binding transcriptional regulator/antitoxin component of YhaV-PrlF toxin-antitoxin module